MIQYQVVKPVLQTGYMEKQEFLDLLSQQICDATQPVGCSSSQSVLIETQR